MSVYCPQHPKELLIFTSDKVDDDWVGCYKCMQEDRKKCFTINSLFEDAENLYKGIREKFKPNDELADKYLIFYEGKDEAIATLQNKLEEEVKSIQEGAEKVEKELIGIVRECKDQAIKEIRQMLPVLEMNYERFYEKAQKYCFKQTDAELEPKYDDLINLGKKETDINGYVGKILSLKRNIAEYHQVLSIPNVDVKNILKEEEAKINKMKTYVTRSWTLGTDFYAKFGAEIASLVRRCFSEYWTVNIGLFGISVSGPSVNLGPPKNPFSLGTNRSQNLSLFNSGVEFKKEPEPKGLDKKEPEKKEPEKKDIVNFFSQVNQSKGERKDPWAKK